MVNYTAVMISATELESALKERPRDADRSRQKILAAASLEFAIHGLSGARVDRIAEKSGLNKRLLYYYFESKDVLFTAALEKAYTDIRQAERTLNLKDLEPIEAIKRLLSFTWSYYLDNPQFISLLNSENLQRGQHISRSSRAKSTNSELIETLGVVLENGRAKGVFRGGIDPVQLYISIAGLAYFYLSNQHTLGAIFDINLLSPKALEQRLSHMQDLIMGYVLIN
jgi:AcrR family transcriptional regulator